MISIAIPSKNERFLKNTIEDILRNATGTIAVYPILDGYEPPEDEIINDERVTYIRLPKTSYSKKRHGINTFVNDYAKTEYIAWCDGHCSFAKGFDEQLIKDHQPNWVQVPRRNRLDAENWCLQDQVDNRPPIDYEYPMWEPLLHDHGLHGFKWDVRTLGRKDILIDDTFAVQASFFFMTKKWFQERGFMDLRYQGWGAESEEVCFETIKHGGRAVVNKHTWYAHLHKGKKYGRMYHLPMEERAKSYAYSYQYWVHDNKDFFINLINSYMPIPNWPENWEELLYGKRT